MTMAISSRTMLMPPMTRQPARHVRSDIRPDARGGHVAPARVPPPQAATPPLATCSPTADPRLMILQDPNSAQSAAFRVLRDTLIMKGLPRVLAVTSPEAGDGKTTCAVNLALALAERGTARLLLLDASFAAPAIAGLLGIDDTAPRDRAWSAPFTLAALKPSLHVATLAQRPGPPSYVDFTTLARQLEAFLRAGYHHVILDMATLDSSPEANLPLPLAGGVLLTVRAGRSRTGPLRRAVERIGPGKALGITLMDAPV
ncbi:hypothetical protein BH11MYX4_BH11MYX4_36680 [soil metagenome]